MEAVGVGVPARAFGGGGVGEVDVGEGARGGPAAEEEGEVVAVAGVEFGEGLGGGVLAEYVGRGGAADDVEQEERDQNDAKNRRNGEE